MFRIGQFSEMSKTTIKTLRYYDEVNLLKPEQVDTETGSRLYTTRQLVTLHRIRGLRQAGLSLDEVRCILQGTDPKAILQGRKNELLAGLREIQSQLSQIDFILQTQEGLSMNYSANLKQLPECIVYSQKLTVPNYDAYFECIPAIGAKMAARYPDLKCASPEYCFIVYLDGEYRESDIHVEFCEAVTEQKPDFDDIYFQKMDAVTAVCVLHKGPYSGLASAYAFAFQWIESNGYLPAGAPRESYIDGIWNKEDSADWLTELQIPVAKKE